ncbi:DUF3552 domain-containing protein, partial [bacterium]|nr:DUF3552 domain-containing protein [bacterium]
MPQIPPYVLPAVAACIGGLAGWLFSRRRQESLHGSAAEHNERMLEDARREAQSLLKTAQLEAKEEFLRAHQQFEEETDRLRKESRRRQEALDMREDNLDKKVTFIDQKEARLVSREEDQALRSDALARDRTDLDRLLVEQNFKLEQIAGMTAESAKRQLMENMVNEARLAAARS